MKIIPIWLLIGLLLFVCSCVEQPKEDVRNANMERSREIAAEFIINSPTYKYDGSQLNVLDSNTLKRDNCYIFVFRFMSTHNGYGNRNQEDTEEQSTEHIVSVLVQNGEVIQAIIDNSWNEIKQRKILNYEIIDGERIEKIPVYYCNEPRPTGCTNENDNVCGSDKQGYANPCQACKTAAVKWYTKGACDNGFADKAIDDLNSGKLTKESQTLLILIGWNME